MQNEAPQNKIRAELVSKLWHGVDPFKQFDRTRLHVDKQGWNSTHSYLRDSVLTLSPQIVVEIGVWKGGSVITLAKTLKKAGIDGVVIAIDTWLGSSEHWLRGDFASLRVETGYPQMHHTFMSNIIDEGLEDYVLPLPLDSLNAHQVLSKRGLQADLIHIDAGHDHRSVSSDITAWWQLLRSGGILIGDDYSPSWPGVLQAFDEFVALHGLPLEHKSNKCRLVKP